MAAACGLFLGVVPAAVAAHEIPADVTVQAFAVPRADTFHLLVRVPLLSMRDYDWPVTAEGYLDVAAARPWLADAARQWIASYVRVLEDGRALGEPRVAAVRLSLPAERFAGWEEARALVDGAPLPDGVRIPAEQAYLAVRLTYAIRDAGAAFALEPEWAHLGVRTVTALRYLPPDGGVRPFQWRGNPGLVRLDPGVAHAFLRFVAEGFRHILGGIDHLLFLACLVLPIARFRGLVPVVTAFTVGHSITLLAAAAGLTPAALWFPSLVETLIAATIVWLALENILLPRRWRRWGVAFGFGLVHGFGFSFALAEQLQFAGAHLATSLLAFNVGVELGQLLVVALLAPALVLFFRHVPRRAGTIVLSALVAHTAWHWMTARGAAFLAHDVAAPSLDLALLAGALRWAAVGVVAVAAAWGLREAFGRWGSGEPVAET